MKRYDKFGYDPDLFPCKDGEWARYDDVKEIAERLIALKPYVLKELAYIHKELDEIINEIRGKE